MTDAELIKLLHDGDEYTLVPPEASGPRQGRGGDEAETPTSEPLFGITLILKEPPMTFHSINSGCMA